MAVANQRNAWVLVFVMIGACGEASESSVLAAPDMNAFASEVYPLLLRDCGMVECHGASARFFRVVGPGRMRLSRDTAALDRATDAEIQLTYDRARSLIDERALLLRKPLAAAGGGVEHGGVDVYGRNVYVDRNDPSYRVLEAWARGGAR
jgi:hypothetical protein